LAKETGKSFFRCQSVVDFFMVGQELTAYILVGGDSRRMGVDKLFLRINGLSLLERVITTCKRCFVTVKLVSGCSDKFSSFNYAVVKDSPMAHGPMAGIIAALEDCESDRCFVTAADLFDLGTKVITTLLSEYKGQQYLGLRESGGVQPLCGIYHASALDTMYEFAQNGEYRMTELVHALAHDVIDLPIGRWRNLNSPEDIVIGGLNG
jgi:molybdopterin-guanine dinucleotide biosynthesis protein A